MKIVNKRALFDYEILERIEAGLVLSGKEARDVRDNRVNLAQAYAKIIGQEAFLINAHMATCPEPTRTRKILLHKRQIENLSSKIKYKKLTLVPLSLYTKGRLVKLELGLARGKRTFEKKDTLKKKDLEREIERDYKVRLDR